MTHNISVQPWQHTFVLYVVLKVELYQFFTGVETFKGAGENGGGRQVARSEIYIFIWGRLSRPK